jgi:hypothetical protein
MPPLAPSTVLAAVPDLDLGHAQHLENDRDRPADQQEPVERRDRANQAPIETASP